MEDVVAVRSAEIVTAEIVMIRDNCRKVLMDSVVQIGTRLEELKQLVPQGQWTAYLTDKLGYKPSTAQNYMRIAREFGGGQVGLDGRTAADTFGSLGYSQLLPLLGMAEEEREELAEEHNLPSMSSREIAALVRERDEAKANADRLKEKDKLLRSKLREANEERDKAQSSLSDATQREKDLAERLDELEKQPAEVRELSEEELDTIRREMRAEADEAVREAETRAHALEEKLEKVKNPAAHKVNFLFHELRGILERLDSALEGLQASDEAAAEKFAKAIADWMRKEGDKLA